MANDAYLIGASLLKTGTLVSFRIVEEEVLTAHDEAEFGMRLLLKFVPEEGEDGQDEDDVAEDTAEWALSDSCLSLACCPLTRRNPGIYPPQIITGRTNLTSRISSSVCGSCGPNCTSTPITFAVVGSKPASLCAPTVRWGWRPSVAARQCCAGSSGCGARSFSNWSVDEGSEPPYPNSRFSASACSANFFGLVLASCSRFLIFQRTAGSCSR